MDTSQLDMLHNRRNEYMLAITDCIRFTFHCMIQESVDQDRSCTLLAAGSIDNFWSFVNPGCSDVPR